MRCDVGQQLPVEFPQPQKLRALDQFVGAVLSSLPAVSGYQCTCDETIRFGRLYLPLGDLFGCLSYRDITFPKSLPTRVTSFRSLTLSWRKPFLGSVTYSRSDVGICNRYGPAG